MSIDLLPTEILLPIMLMDVWDNNNDPARLVWVCRRWTAVALATPELWASIAVTTGSRSPRDLNPWDATGWKRSRHQLCSFAFIPACLRRCRMKPRELQLVIGKSCHENHNFDWSGIDNLFQAQWDRCESLELIGYFGVVPQQIADLVRALLPKLTHLKIHAGRGSIETTKMVKTAFVSVFKSTTLFSLDVVGPTALTLLPELLINSSLTTMSLVRSTVSVGQLEHSYPSSFFLRLSALEELYIKQVTVDNPSTGESFTPMLPSLRKLIIMDAATRLLVLHTNNMNNSSKLTHLSIIIPSTETGLHDFPGPITLPSLRSLIMHGMGVKHAPNILAPNLYYLEMESLHQQSSLIEACFRDRVPSHHLDSLSARIELLPSLNISISILMQLRRLRELTIIYPRKAFRQPIRQLYVALCEKSRNRSKVLFPALESLCLDSHNRIHPPDETRMLLKQFSKARHDSPLNRVTLVWSQSVDSHSTEVIFSR